MLVSNTTSRVNEATKGNGTNPTTNRRLDPVALQRCLVASPVCAMVYRLLCNARSCFFRLLPTTDDIRRFNRRRPSSLCWDATSCRGLLLTDRGFNREVHLSNNVIWGVKEISIVYTQCRPCLIIEKADGKSGWLIVDQKYFRSWYEHSIRNLERACFIANGNIGAFSVSLCKLLEVNRTTPHNTLEHKSKSPFQVGCIY